MHYWDKVLQVRDLIVHIPYIHTPTSGHGHTQHTSWHQYCTTLRLNKWDGMVAANENHSSHLTTANPFRRNHAHTSNTGIDITIRWHWIINTQSSPFSQQTSTKNLKHLYWEQVEKYYLQVVNSRAHTNTPAILTTFTYFVESSRLSMKTLFVMLMAITKDS